MKISATFISLSLLMCSAACAPAGYYDANGDYRSYGKSDSYRTSTVRDDGAPGNPDNHTAYAVPAQSTTTVIYDRPGYYDSNGYYVSADNFPTAVPKSMLPPRGMCRVWFADRPARYQPEVESCSGIQSRVPEGAYVIYGG